MCIKHENNAKHYEPHGYIEQYSFYKNNWVLHRWVKVESNELADKLIDCLCLHRHSMDRRGNEGISWSEENVNCCQIWIHLFDKLSSCMNQL